MTEKICRLSLKWQPLADIPDRFALETRLDDTPFIDLVREWELEHVPEQEKELAGDYMELRFWSLGSSLIWLKSLYLKPQKLSSGSGRATLLGCPCGILECWPLEADITITDEHVIWSNFLQPHRPDTWSYDGFGPFTFHRAQYEAEVRRAIASAPD
ncbi:hypothetical protein ACFP81_09095 [Deinococcus lacus]|uniref:Uncharacterized protein n=1 Tax=Deinococcus lacus TaxID=392561 RepID=A0ABW1YCT2_9DEIO